MLLPATNPTDVLILTRRDIAALMTQADYLAAAELAFRALATGAANAPPPMHLQAHGGAFHVKGASLEGEQRVVAVKLNGNFPGNPQKHGLPTIQGAILFADASSGSLLAVIDSIEITLRRTAAASALAARHLARPESSRLAICGCGEQGRAQLEALAAIFPLQRVAAWDQDAERTREFAARMHAALGIDVLPVSAVETATSDADIIVTCTTAREPFLGVTQVSKGTFIAAVRADNPEKSEIMPALMARSRIVADVLDQCVAMGDLHHAIAAGAVARSAVWAELGEIVTSRKAGRATPEEIIVFDSTGTAAQDVAAAAIVHARAVEHGTGLHVALGAA